MGKLNSSKAILFALICVISWSFVPVVARVGQVNLDNTQFLFWSNLLSTFVILFSILVCRKLKFISKYSPLEFLQFALLGFLGCCFYYLCLYWGYASGEGLQVLVFQYTWPIYTVVFSLVFLKEKLNNRRIISCVLSFIGFPFIFAATAVTTFEFIQNPNIVLLFFLYIVREIPEAAAVSESKTPERTLIIFLFIFVSFLF